VTARFDPVIRRTLAQEVREAVLVSIRSGEFPPGAQLPAERSLSEQFAVARTSVREALQGLVSLGVIERRGNRSYVAELLPEVTLPDDRKRSVTDVFEVRRLVEVPMAELVACRATAEERHHIRRLGQAFRSDMPLDEFRRADREFHTAIAKACGNPVLAELHGKVLESLFRSADFDSLLTATQNQAVVRRLIRDAAIGHKQIAVHLARTDAEAVGKAAEEHLNQVEALMIAQMT
jgi:GntR family transcriptional repressor for pyruvate dehydrogenase complex